MKASEQLSALIDAYIELAQNHNYNDSQIIDSLTDIFDEKDLVELGFGDFVFNYFHDEEIPVPVGVSGLTEELAILNAEKTMIDVYLDSDGQKRIHYLGYFYEDAEGLRLNEYTGYDVPFSDVQAVGVLNFEAQNSDALGGQQYFTEYKPWLSRNEIFAVINNYFEEAWPVHLSKDRQFDDLPVGVYAISLYTKDELTAKLDAGKANVSVDAILGDAGERSSVTVGAEVGKEKMMM